MSDMNPKTIYIEPKPATWGALLFSTIPVKGAEKYIHHSILDDLVEKLDELESYNNGECVLLDDVLKAIEEIKG